MKTIYRAAYTLCQNSTLDELLDRISALAWGWVLNPNRVQKLGPPLLQPPRVAGVLAEQDVLPGGWKVQTHRVVTDGTVAWGFRLRHPDAGDSDFEWVTEVTVASKQDAPAFFTCSSSIVDRSQVIRPIHRRPSRPGIVERVLDDVGGKSIYPLLTKPMDLSESDNDCDTLVKALTSQNRRHPLVMISVDNESQQSLIDPLKMASHLAGLAHVVLARSSDVTWKLRATIPNQLNCYHGAVRLYWPGLKLTDSSYQHPLWPPQIFSKYRDATKEVTSQILEAISAIAASKLPDQGVSWDQLLELDRRRAIAEAKALARAEADVSGKTNAWAQMLEADNLLQSERIRILESRLASQAEETERQRSLAETYRFALGERKTADAESNDISASHSIPPESVAQAVENAERDHLEKLAFACINKGKPSDCLYQSPEEVERALNWLATTYWLARTGKQPCSDLDKSVRELIPGWSYSGGQKKHSVGKHESWYHCKWNGKDYWIGEHLGCGISKRPEETIRIAFAWDNEDKKVVIGFIGQHQRNTNT